ncbi:hypothetical protein OG709_15700 [Streptomyces sp. NBC_01267]|uniref:hypothetical protein n=1 Tax=Streptomyces sp. NBC_01267 TaxID=2903805 RepID=UPI002E32A88A|nr:hypothetical protein [Streptomyces sp. NBC_01267]
MGIESDQLVYDYLSRVGDLAQRQLPSAERMRLVSSLRSEIDRQRASADAGTPAGVRRILGRLGTPAEQVAAAAGGTPLDTGRAEPEQAVRERTCRIPRPRRTEKAEPPPARSTAASPPHLAGEDELGTGGGEPDWWRIQPGPFGAGDAVHGFTGGVEIPEILKPPPEDEDANGAADEDGADGPDGEGAEPVEAAPRGRALLGRRRAAGGGDATGDEGDAGGGDGAAGGRAAYLRTFTGVFSSPVLLLAAVLLVVGAVLGSLLVLGAGWIIAYMSRRLTRAEAKWAVLGLPGTVALGGIVWLWGRSSGHWGSAIPEHGMGGAISGVWPVALRAAAGASALYLVWRSRRRA